MSDVPIVVCYCLLRFANRVAMKSNRDETGVAASHKHGRQSPWLPAGRELGITTIAERPGSSQFESGGQDAGSRWGPRRTAKTHGYVRTGRNPKKL
jgi:hypothetical protein